MIVDYKKIKDLNNFFAILQVFPINIYNMIFSLMEQKVTEKARESTGQQLSWLSIENLKSNITWKHGVLLLIPAFIMYPKPFLWILKPLIKRIQKNYSETEPKLTKIVLTKSRQIDNQSRIKRQGKGKDMCYTINLFESYPQQEKKTFSKSVDFNKQVNQIHYIEAENVLLRIKMIKIEHCNKNSSNFWILIKGNQQTLRIIEAKLYGLNLEEYYKIPKIKEDQVHELQCTDNRETYEQKVLTSKQVFNTS